MIGKNAAISESKAASSALPQQIHHEALGLAVDSIINSYGLPASQAAGCALSLLELRALEANLRHFHDVFTTPYGEWTGDFIDFGLEEAEPAPTEYIPVAFIKQPAAVVFREGRWIAVGGERIVTYLPPEGWVLPGPTGEPFHPLSGLPAATISQADMERTDTIDRSLSYFWRAQPGAGVVAIARIAERFPGSYFDLSATLPPASRHPHIGLRRYARLA